MRPITVLCTCSIFVDNLIGRYFTMVIGPRNLPLGQLLTEDHMIWACTNLHKKPHHSNECGVNIDPSGGPQQMSECG